jgi:hypothetical protein
MASDAPTAASGGNDGRHNNQARVEMEAIAPRRFVRTLRRRLDARIARVEGLSPDKATRRANFLGAMRV